MARSGGRAGVHASASSYRDRVCIVLSFPPLLTRHPHLAFRRHPAPRSLLVSIREPGAGHARHLDRLAPGQVTRRAGRLARRTVTRRVAVCGTEAYAVGLVRPADTGPGYPGGPGARSR